MDNGDQFQLVVLEQILFCHSQLHGGVYMFLCYVCYHRIRDHLHKARVLLRYLRKHSINHTVQDQGINHLALDIEN